MKKFKIRKRILALLISGNIMLSGCSMFGNVSDKKMESSDESYTQSSIDSSKPESSREKSSKNESSINNKEQSSKEESIEEVESSIEESLEISEYTSVEESSEVEFSTDEEETSTKEESSDEESSTSEESEKEEEVSVKEESSKLESKVEEESSKKNEESSSEEEDIEDEFDDEYEEDSKDEYEQESNVETSELDEEDKYVYTDDNMYIYADDTVNIRTYPNTDCDILGLLYEDKSLKKLGYVGDKDWYIVDYNGKEAFVSGLYSHEEKQVKTETKPETKTDNNLKISNVCYFPDGSTLYSDARLTKKIKYIPELESAEIYKQEGNSYYVETDGDRGYVSKSSATLLSKPVAVVDISMQYMTYYYVDPLTNVITKKTIPVITGNETPDFYYPTDRGLFYFYSKVEDAILEGPLVYNEYTGEFVPQWHSECKWFMEFHDGMGVHNADWKNRKDFGSKVDVKKYIKDFGTKTYLSYEDISQIPYDYVPAFLRDYGSHGCINLLDENIDDVVYIFDKGDKILVKN